MCRTLYTTISIKSTRLFIGEGRRVDSFDIQYSPHLMHTPYTHTVCYAPFFNRVFTLFHRPV